jgi:rubrerythrin
MADPRPLGPVPPPAAKYACPGCGYVLLGTHFGRVDSKCPCCSAFPTSSFRPVPRPVS